jgi:hypothetical protein
MKILIMTAALALAAGPALAAGRGAKRVGRKEATKAALAAVPGARVESAEHEREDGHDIWSFDLKTKEGVREVWVDAKSGKVISNSLESAAETRKEAVQDSAETAARRRKARKSAVRKAKTTEAASGTPPPSPAR